MTEPTSPVIRRLRDRCRVFLNEQTRNAMLRQGSPVDDLVAFVISETGRRADHALDEALPLCLYFGNEADREEFIAVIHEIKPTMISRKMP